MQPVHTLALKGLASHRFGVYDLAPLGGRVGVEIEGAVKRPTISHPVLSGCIPGSYVAYVSDMTQVPVLRVVQGLQLHNSRPFTGGQFEVGSLP